MASRDDCTALDEGAVPGRPGRSHPAGARSPRATGHQPGTLQRWCLSASKRTRPDGEPYAHQTVLGWWRVAKQLLQDAAAEHDLPDPTRRVRPPSTQIAKRRKRNALTRGQLAQVLEAVHEVHPEWYAEVYTLAYTGMRPGELYALQWRDIDLANGWIHIRRAVWRDKVDKTKTGSERRAPLTDAIREALKRKQRGLPSALVFPAANGAHRLPQSLLTMLKRLCKQYGLPHTTPYTFRYTFRTLMRDSGAPTSSCAPSKGTPIQRWGSTITGSTWTRPPMQWRPCPPHRPDKTTSPGCAGILPMPAARVRLLTARRPTARAVANHLYFGFIPNTLESDVSAGGRWVIRTPDFYRVKVAGRCDINSLTRHCGDTRRHTCSQGSTRIYTFIYTHTAPFIPTGASWQ